MHAQHLTTSNNIKPQNTKDDLSNKSKSPRQVLSIVKDKSENRSKNSKSRNEELTSLQNSLNIMMIQVEELKQEIQSSNEENIISNIHSKLTQLNQQIQSKEQEILNFNIQKQSQNIQDESLEAQKLLNEQILKQELMDLHQNLQRDLKNQSSKRAQQNSYRSQMSKANKMESIQQDKLKNDYIMKANKIIINPKKKGDKIEISSPMQIDSQMKNLENVHLSSLLIDPSQISQANQNLISQKID